VIGNILLEQQIKLLKQIDILAKFRKLIGKANHIPYVFIHFWILDLLGSCFLRRARMASRQARPWSNRGHHHDRGGPHDPAVAARPCLARLGSWAMSTMGCPWCFPWLVVTPFSVAHPKECLSLYLFNFIPAILIRIGAFSGIFNLLFIEGEGTQSRDRNLSE